MSTLYDEDGVESEVAVLGDNVTVLEDEELESIEDEEED